jgi:hypothetical protein
VPGTLAALSARSGLRRVLAAYGLFDVVEMYAWLVVVLWAYERGGPSLAAVASIVQLVPAALLAPVLGGIGDRMPRGRALLLAHGAVALFTGLTAVALLVEAAPVVVVGSSACLTVSMTLVRPAHFAAVPQLSSESPAQLVSANALSSVSDGVSRFVGPVLAGTAYALTSAGVAMALALVLMVVATALCLGLRLARPSGDGGESGLAATFAGFKALWSDRTSFALLISMALTFVLAGSLDILGVSFAQEVLGGDEATAGVVIGSLGIGGLLGAVVGSVVAGRRRLGRYVVAGGVVGGAAFAAVSLVGVLGVVAVVLVVAGTAGALTMVAGRTLLQRSTDDAVLARVFAVQESISLAGVAIGAAAAPLLISWLGQPLAWVPLGAACLLVALLCLPAVRRLDARARYLPEELAVLRAVPFLEVLPPYELERLALRSRWRDVPAGGVVVRQGDEGHEFFAVESGRLYVEVDGVRRRELGAGDFFGEISLLHSVRRTATVTAEEPTRVLIVGRVDFLAAVTGSADGHAVAREMGARYEDRQASREGA